MHNMFSNHHVKKTIANKALITSKDLPLRRLKLHEYQAGKLLSKFRVPIPLGNVAYNA